MEGATFHIHNDRCEWRLDGHDGEVAFRNDGTFSEKIHHIISGLPGRTWHGYRGNMTITQHGKGMTASDTRGIIMGRWQPHSSNTITIVTAPIIVETDEQTMLDAEH